MLAVRFSDDEFKGALEMKFGKPGYFREISNRWRIRESTLEVIDSPKYRLPEL
ncbi:MAG: hypothetical protein AAGA96_19235 [Verrucomicrobiota bacterium]